ncbi:hypothetical protein K457DRAFT_139472 [Linnemannia elongata AG-77]|uniref:Uncharacterized protein n=1 Tax=Linnemannia elongata AG-77 TaxID=1314771 RepID=A0A197JQJ6_9FUNG|nr:hypothetical protein K457DRAFT_139472 [Linnemannia elongata AG-77]
MPSVPEECLWLIVSYLRHERAALHALLLTNSTFFRIAVSFLYSSPFRILDEEPNYHWNVIEKTRRYDVLLHLLIQSSHLLSHIDENGRRVMDLPRYGPEVTPLPSPSTIDYLSYYTNMFHDPMLHQTFMTLFPTIPNCYQTDVVWYRSMVETRNRIEYAMMDRLLPQVTSLTIAIPIQVPRIKIGYMSNLRRLEVIGTDLCWLTEDDLQAAQVLPVNRTTRGSMGYKITRLDRMLMFIWDHQRIFGTLRELQIENKPVVFDSQPSGRLIELVEAMGERLEVLEVRHWPDAILFLDRIPTRYLRRLLLHLSKEPGPIFAARENMATFLAQCPELQEFSMYMDERDLLAAWRPQYQRSLQQQPSMSDYGWQGGQILTMSPIKRISIGGLAPNVIAVINEAVDLFAASLETISARTWFSGKPVTVPLAWPSRTLDKLTELDLEGEVAWTFDYGSLMNCPRLCRMRLGFTGPKPKRPPAIHYLTRLVTLQDLELIGNWQTLAIQGWPKVVAEMYHLERLELIGCEGITSDQLYAVVRDIIDQSYSWRLREQRNGGSFRSHEEVLEFQLPPSTSTTTMTTTMTTTAAVHDLFYKTCRLRWVIANRRLEDGLQRHWSELKLAHSDHDGSPYMRASLDRVRFSWVTTARPSR